MILGIESSCDETGVGIVRGHELLANEVASSVEEHVRFGGVVPEVASRAHLEAMVPTLQRACATADVDLTEIDAIAVTAGPGLMGALVVGLAAAKALALRAGQAALRGQPPGRARRRRPARARSRCPGPASRCWSPAGTPRCCRSTTSRPTITELGATIDDAAGEAYDKVARLLGLPYPGGPHIDRAATDGDPTAIRFPRGLTAGKDLDRHRFDFSFSGLKTAVARWVETRGAVRAADPGGRCRRQLPGGGLRRADRQGGGRLRRHRRHRPADRGRGGGQPPAPGAAGRAGRGGRDLAAHVRGPPCAPTTGP